MVFCNLNIILLGVFVNGVVTTPILTPITMENVEASNDGRECKLLKDCLFYQQFEMKEIMDSLRQAIENDITQHTCGLNVYREVEKGNLIDYIEIKGEIDFSKYKYIYIINTNIFN